MRAECEMLPDSCTFKSNEQKCDACLRKKLLMYTNAYWLHPKWHIGLIKGLNAVEQVAKRRGIEIDRFRVIKETFRD